MTTSETTTPSTTTESELGKIWFEGIPIDNIYVYLNTRGYSDSNPSVKKQTYIHIYNKGEANKPQWKEENRNVDLSEIAFYIRNCAETQYRMKLHLNGDDVDVNDRDEIKINITNGFFNITCIGHDKQEFMRYSINLNNIDYYETNVW